MNKMVTIGASAALLIAWLLPNHYLPWTSFSQDYSAFIALLLLLLGLAASRRPISVATPFMASLIVALACVPIAQTLRGLTYLPGDGWLAAIYLLGFALAWISGYSIAKGSNASALAIPLAWLFLMAAITATAIAAYQWLGLEGLGIFAADLRPGKRPIGNLGQANNHATLLCMGLAAGLYLHSKAKLGPTSTVLVVAYLTLGIAMAQSRTSWLCALLLLIWWAWQGRAFTRLPATAITLGITAYTSLVWLWPNITMAVGAIGYGEQRLADVGVRSILWVQLLDAATRSPWLGYGWNQVSVAQLAVAAEYPRVAFVEHSHNLFIDLLIWNGIPLGLLLIFGVCYWGLTRAFRTRTPESWFALLAIGYLFIHSMLEFPLEYAYFLLPMGLLIGLVDADQGVKPTLTLTLPRPILWGLVAAGTCLAALIWHEYRLIEEDHRLLRFESARIGTLVAAQTAPDVRLLSQLREFQRFARTQAKPGMTTEQLEWTRKVAHRYPYPPALFRYTLALGMNGQTDAAKLELQRLRQLHGDELYKEAIGGIRSLAESSRPELHPLLRN